MIYRNREEHETLLTHILLKAFADIYPEATKKWRETEEISREAADLIFNREYGLAYEYMIELGYPSKYLEVARKLLSLGR